MRWDKKNNRLFIHIPKTGGCAVDAVLDEQMSAYKVRHRWHGLAGQHLTRAQFIAHEPGAADAFMFTFVRHPVNWWESLWRYLTDSKHWRRRRGKFDRLYGPQEGFDYHPMRVAVENYHEDFEAFVRGMFDIRPAYASQLFAEYCVGASYIGRQETLYADLKRIYGYALPLAEVNKSKWQFPDISLGLRKWICEQEEWAVEMFYGFDTMHNRKRGDWHGTQDPERLAG